MTPCENYWEALNAFADGECSPEEEAALRAHLADCAACREALAELTALRDGFPSWEDEAVPEGFADGVLQKIAEAPQQAPKKAQRKRSGTAWASLAACLGVMVLLGSLFPGLRSASSANNAAPASDAAVTTGGQAIEPQSGETEDVLMGTQSMEAGGEDPSKLMMDRAKLTQAGADLRWTLTADEERELLSGYDCRETEDGRVYTLTAGDLESVRAQAEEEGISLWEDPSTVYATATPAAPQPPDPTASPDTSANSYANSGGGESETYQVLIQPMEEN